jgi:hypothetical protein
MTGELVHRLQTELDSAEAEAARAEVARLRTVAVTQSGRRITRFAVRPMDSGTRRAIR